MPKFDGDNVQGWFYKAKMYLRYHNIPDEERIIVATMNMKEKHWSGYYGLTGKIRLNLCQNL